MWQQILIAVAVVGAASYVVWTLMSPRLRLRFIDRVARSGFAAGWAARQRARLSADGCGNCSAAAGRTPAQR